MFKSTESEKLKNILENVRRLAAFFCFRRKSLFGNAEQSLRELGGV